MSMMPLLKLLKDNDYVIRKYKQFASMITFSNVANVTSHCDENSRSCKIKICMQGKRSIVR